jgi:two-component system, NtrC family, response regulator AtoC
VTNSNRDGDPSAASDCVVQDAAMIRLHEMAAAIARGNISVLIVGETGSGKEILAEAIHRQSPRHAGPFLRLNCAALQEGLLESELFGHEKGAFTGAFQAKPGLLETADGGTVFLDEIGEMPLPIQAKLLRVMEERAVRAVGARQPRPIRVRFIFATNRNLEAEMERGTFRRDLYHRLGGAVLTLPPLRQRRAEIEPLARLFLARAARELDSPTPPTLTPATLDQLCRHDWPGNIRELRNVIERALLLCEGPEITPEHLPAHWQELPEPPELPPGGAALGHSTLAREDLAAVSGGRRSALAPAPRPDPTWDVERQRIGRALDMCAGNQTRAARLLEMSRATLIRRLSAYGFARPRSAAVTPAPEREE